MEPIKRILLVPLLIALASCATVAPGNDPVLVGAQQTISAAQNTFALIEKTEYEVYPSFKSADPESAAKVRTFVNTLRANQKHWLSTAFSLQETYRTNRSSENKANLQTALAVLADAIAKSNEYLALMNNKGVWLSPDMSVMFAQINAAKK